MSTGRAWWRPGIAAAAADRSAAANLHENAAASGPGQVAPPAGPAGLASALHGFASAWARHSASLNASRAVGLLHVAAAALAVGLLAGMYLRGLVLDYRAGWESTFLSAEQAHSVLSRVLAPAVALSNVPLPGVAEFAALRQVPGQVAAGAPAAAWIHWYALTLALFVVGPRLVLALVSAWRARALAKRFPLPLGDAYFQRLVRHQHGGTARVWAVPYAQAPSQPSEQGLRAVLARLHGDEVQVHMAPTVAFGTEDELATSAPLAAGTTLAIALFDLTATPEAENQGRFIERLRQQCTSAGAPVVALIDESAFIQRFGARTERQQQRRAAWQQLADRLACPAVFVALASPDLAVAENAMQAAVRV
jgi:hypothetical protein